MTFKLFDAIFVLPVQTAPVEHGFSMHCIVKNCLTSRLKITTLRHCRAVANLGVVLDSIDVESAVSFHSGACREKG